MVGIVSERDVALLLVNHKSSSNKNKPKNIQNRYKGTKTKLKIFLQHKKRGSLIVSVHETMHLITENTSENSDKKY